ncbi:MAG: hypothetical protein FWG70_00420 [Oscillospiraceae bacterium]|nr:hypothetical protein [Oscillospiraceae bacterium]
MISIDITDTRIKLLDAAVSGKIAVKKAVVRDLPPGCIENGRILDMHIVAGEITDILVTEKISEREAVICINSGMILYREIEIPKPKAGSENFVVETIIQNEMSLGDEYNITYSISEEIITDEGPKLKVIAAACPQSMIDIYLELSRQVGLKAKLVVVSNSCITRLVRRSSVYKAFSPLLVLQVDKNFININLYHKGGAVAFSRHTKIEASDYENSKDYINLAIFDNLFRTMHLLEQTGLGEGLKEVQYFGTVQDERTLHGTIEKLELTAREFEFPNDLVKSKRDFNFLEFAGVIGSLIKVDDKTENINLLNTKEKRIRTLNMRFSLIALFAAGICAALVFAVFAVMQIVIGAKENTLADKEKVFVALDYEGTQSRVNELKTAITKLENYANDVDTAKALYEFQPRISREIPEKILRVIQNGNDGEEFEGMSVRGSFGINGYTLTVNFTCKDETHPAKFTEALIEDGYFENIKFYGYDRIGSQSELGQTGEDTFTFTLNMRIKGGHVLEP